MKTSIEKMASEFLELASEQRLQIILELLQNNYTLSNLSKKLDATTPEVHRNVSRLLKKNIIQKNSDGSYSLTFYGMHLCKQFPSLFFILDNQKFFQNHDFGNIPAKYIHRLGELEEGEFVDGFVNVLARWTKLHQNSNQYVCNILSEIPYHKDLIDIIELKLNKGIRIQSIFSNNIIIPKERKELFTEKDFSKYVKNDLLQRKMNHNTSIMLLLNETEAAVIFPMNDGQIDMSHMLVGNSTEFHEWCLDLFNEYWKNSTNFQESKLASS